ncbi:hypothetical protein EMIT0158MI4_20332 [Burkholderia ambifaria]
MFDIALSDKSGAVIKSTRKSLHKNRGHGSCHSASFAFANENRLTSSSSTNKPTSFRDRRKGRFRPEYSAVAGPFSGQADAEGKHEYCAFEEERRVVSEVPVTDRRFPRLVGCGHRFRLCDLLDGGHDGDLFGCRESAGAELFE